ncbi:hypothetical protein HUT19_11735 [Streptomyces sp. NA02950]|uniref:hypothetical protein n=1 Tax=Streptomyces sp. NA02950 TaxID=2742137 RepID=UPI00158FAD16|nr:hypothetical protein [Streptomyces sp. NA02950]QKV92336.1 hypothetical protein HUT19_11735 [Streptomyces sp. NA02950]
MRPSPTRATIALGLFAGALLWNAAASPATASGSASWREAGHFDTGGACQRAGREGIRRHKWDEYKCRPGRGDAYVTLWVRGGRSRAGAPHPALAR